MVYEVLDLVKHPDIVLYFVTAYCAVSALYETIQQKRLNNLLEIPFDMMTGKQRKQLANFCRTRLSEDSATLVEMLSSSNPPAKD